MGTAREPVAGSGTWPACTARVANCCCFGSDITTLLRSLEKWVAGMGLLNGVQSLKHNRPESFRGPGRSESKLLRLTHAPFESRTYGSAWHTHSHGPARCGETPPVLALHWHQGKYRGCAGDVSTNNAVNTQGSFCSLLHSSAFHTYAPGCGRPICASTRQTNCRAISAESAG